MSHETDETAVPEAVAVIGMAGRFPGARNLDELWRNLRDGVDCVRDLTDEELLASGVPAEQLRQPGYVRAAGPIADADLFDAGFFGFSPREAEVLDPQQRVFLETAWEALEAAGCVSESYPGWIGMFAGIAFPTYLLHNLLPNLELVESVGSFPLMLANDRDYFATRVSYKLNLRGTSVNVQTACSTSLVAVHMACQSLLDYQCTVALAGGVRVFTPQLIGYTYAEGGIYSPDGRCRAFDAEGKGALFSEGCGVVVLKRLSEALADGDIIHAVIRGSATNNDGSNKVGYTAPSIDGQAEVIVMAQAAAGVEPDAISYVETHGSGTPLGDPIEVAALTQAFRSGTDRTGFCALGSLKASVGHMESAAGVGGLIKTVLALEHRQIPPSLHFRTPNPRIDFDSSPFYVNTQLAPWSRHHEPRRAGVSSFGMGGTNAHVIVEEAPEREPSDPGRPWQLLLLSALTPTALEAATDRLADWMEVHPEAPLADVAFTLQNGRRTFAHRRALVCESAGDALAALRERDPKRLLGNVQEIAERPVVLMFPGLGDHYVDMGLDLYQTEPAFRDEIDRCAGLLLPELGVDIRTVIYPRGTGVAVRQTGALDLKAMLGRAPARTGESDEAAQRLNRTLYAQPALFAVEYALAKLLEERGLRPAALVGYSLGEYVAACLAGVLSLEDALTLVAGRAKLVDELEAGAMLAVPLPEAEARQALPPGLSLAAVNGPSLSVVAGPVADVEALERKLSADGIACRRLPTTHAFHSSMMEPIRERVVRMAGQVRLSPPEVPYLSNVTGTWITAAEATDPDYWGRHLCQPVRFGQALTELRSDPARVLLEAGPGLGLTTLSLQTAEGDAPLALPTLRPSYERQPDSAFLLGTLAKLWLAGLSPYWAGLSSGETRQRLRLPTYPFERQRYWIDAPGQSTKPETRQAEEPAPLARHSRPGHLRNLYAPPTNELERGLCEIWQDILGLDEIGIHDSFFELGGHSLVAPRMILKVREVLGVDFPLTHLFEEPTVAGMAKAMETLRTEGHLSATNVDLVAETVLAADVRAEGEAPDPERIASPKEVFLTGATGFLGAFLLRELLRQTGARVHCLVRARNAADGLERIRRKLAEAGIWSEGMARRIAAVPGDLEQPRWGLTEAAYDDLAGRVDAVYHCGAWVNFTYPYKALKAANVLSTEEALRFAGRRRTKPVHFISSIAAVSPSGVTGEPVVLEDADYPTTEGLFAGYGPTKWVSERLVTAARERGIPGSLYRPGVLAGDSRNGYGNTQDLVWNLIKGSIQLGAAPDQEELMDVAPVDYVAAAIVRLSLSSSQLGRTFHFPNPEPASWREVYDTVRAYGYSLRRLTPDEWLDELRTAIRKGADNTLAPFAPLLDDAAEGDAEPASTAEPPRQLRFDDRNTRAGLEGSGIACPPLDAGLLTLWLDAFVRSGFLRPPGR